MAYDNQPVSGTEGANTMTYSLIVPSFQDPPQSY